MEPIHQAQVLLESCSPAVHLSLPPPALCVEWTHIQVHRHAPSLFRSVIDILQASKLFDAIFASFLDAKIEPWISVIPYPEILGTQKPGRQRCSRPGEGERHCMHHPIMADVHESFLEFHFLLQSKT